MSAYTYYSIDQNSHSLWDTVPKLQVLAGRGLTGVHYIEDIDAAFTRRGARPGDQTPLQLRPESYYRDGTSDWGAALFYTSFLGRNPVNVREIEAYTGISSRALARRLGLSVDQLYAQYSVSDNLQLTGSSYVFDQHSHRVIGDLQTSEIAPHVNALMDYARHDLESVFPDSACRARIDAWFAQESGQLQKLLDSHCHAPLPSLYQEWLRYHLGNKVKLSLTSRLFAAGPDKSFDNPLLSFFLTDYARAAASYNDALEETGIALTPLDPDKGELPFFAVWSRDHRMFRTPMAVRDRRLYCGPEEWPLERGQRLRLDKMADNGLVAVTGKALVMVIEVRRRDGGASLALPENGSLYMPAAYAWQRRLKKIGIETADTLPVLRVKMNFLDQLRNCRGVRIRPPLYLRRDSIGEEIDLADFAESLPALQRQATRELESARDDSGREQLANRLSSSRIDELSRLNEQRRQLARDPETRGRASELWEQIKILEQEKLNRLVGRIIDNLHITRLNYWNSRGALMPWSIAAGGMEFYQQLLKQAVIEEENA